MRGVYAAAAAVTAAFTSAASAPPAAGPAFRLELVGTSPGASGIVHLALGAPSGGRATIYVPARWGLDLDRPAASVVARGTLEAGEAKEQGTFTVAAPATAAAACAPAPVTTAWAWGGSAPVRIEVAPTTGADRDLGAYRLDVCAPAPLALELAFAAKVFVNPPAVGLYTWRALLGQGESELQSQVPVPHALSVRASASRGRLAVRGQLRVEGLREQGARVVVLGGRTRSASGGRVLGTARTGGSGDFTLRTRLRGVRWVWARTLARPAACARPVGRSCSAVVAPAFAPATRVATP